MNWQRKGLPGNSTLFEINLFKPVTLSYQARTISTGFFDFYHTYPAVL